ncbi:unnamed protein product [Penicillium manginii]
MDLLSALRVIQNASDECLQRYASETISTIRGVSHRLQQNLLLHSSYDSPNTQSTPPFDFSSSSPPGLPQTTPKGTPAVSVGLTPLSPPRSPQGPHSVAQFDFSLETPRQHGDILEFQSPTRSPGEQFENSNAVSPNQAVIPAEEITVPLPPHPEKRASPDNVLGVLRGILKSIDLVASASKNGQNVLVTPKRHIFSDLRLEHIQRVERKARFSTADDILLNILALRSIASEFTREQILANQSIKLDEIYEYAKSGNENDTERDTLWERRLFRFDERDFSGTVLREGLKHLVLETLVAERLQETNPTSSVTTSSIMVVSALVGFHKDSFRRLRYKEMPNLAVDISSTIIPESGDLLLDFVREHSPCDVYMSTPTGRQKK